MRAIAPLRRLGEPGDVAEAVLGLARSRYATGAVIPAFSHPVQLAGRLEASAEQAGLLGRGLQAVPAIAGVEGFTAILAAYRRGWVAGGRAEGTEEVQNRGGADLPQRLHRRGPRRGTRPGQTRRTALLRQIAQATRAWSTERSADYPGYENLANVGALPHFDKRLGDDHILAGDVEDVRAQLIRVGAAYGTDITVSLTIHSGNLPIDVAKRTLDFIADKIAPEFA